MAANPNKKNGLRVNGLDSTRITHRFKLVVPVRWHGEMQVCIGSKELTAHASGSRVQKNADSRPTL